MNQARTNVTRQSVFGYMIRSAEAGSSTHKHPRLAVFLPVYYILASMAARRVFYGALPLCYGTCTCTRLGRAEDLPMRSYSYCSYSSGNSNCDSFPMPLKSVRGSEQETYLLSDRNGPMIKTS
jgi:hypothetical protein